ncbi:hypothetical protein RRSWK_05753 [Rhodopirellula sp. SWK7]|nr:hypothetical protein RRSWK_05753 [Rhodopirellula sp. SWK7]
MANCSRPSGFWDDSMRTIGTNGHCQEDEPGGSVDCPADSRFVPAENRTFALKNL